MKLYIVILAKDKGVSSLLFFDIFVLLKREISQLYGKDKFK